MPVDGRTQAQARLSEFQQAAVRLSQLATRFTAWIGSLDVDALQAAQASHDALAAQRLVQDVLLSSMAHSTEPQDLKA